MLTSAYYFSLALGRKISVFDTSMVFVGLSLAYLSLVADRPNAPVVDGVNFESSKR